MKRLYGSKASLVFIISAFIGYGLTYFYNLTLAKYLGVSQYGEVSLAFQIIGILGTVFALGLPMASNIFIPKYNTQNRKDKSLEFIQWSGRLIFRNVIVTMILLAIMYVILYAMVKGQYIAYSEIHPVFYFLSYFPIFSMYTVVVNGYIKSAKHIFISELLEVIIFNTMILLGLLLFVFFSHNISILDVLAVYFIANLIGLILACGIYYDFFGNLDFLTLKKNKADLVDKKQWIKDLIDISIDSFVYMIFYSGPFLVLKIVYLFHTQIEHSNDLGYFSACSVIVGALWPIILNCYLDISPKISSVGASEEAAKQLNAEIQKNSMVGLLMVSAGYLIIAVFGKHILSTFGPMYVSSYPVLMLMGFQVFFYMFGGVSGSGLIESGFVVIYNYIVTICCVLFYVLGIILTYYYALIGLAIAMNIAWGCKILACHYYLRKKTLLKGLGFI